MSIVVTCANGHRLSAPEKLAGTVGKCPACGAEVHIPERRETPSESSILRILGVGKELRENIANYDAQESTSSAAAPPAQDAKQDAFEDMDSGSFNSPSGHHKKAPARKVCPQCDWEIDAAYKICPKCRYYFFQR